MTCGKDIKAWVTGQSRKLTHLRSSSTESLPVQSGKDVEDHIRVQLNLILNELRVFGVKRECVGGALASLNGASNKVDAQDLHFWNIFWL